MPAPTPTPTFPLLLSPPGPSPLTSWPLLLGKVEVEIEGTAGERDVLFDTEFDRVTEFDDKEDVGCEVVVGKKGVNVGTPSLSVVALVSSLVGGAS